MRKTYALAAGGGSYTASGTDANLNKGQSLPGDPGAYVVTGADATILRGLLESAATGSYAVAGQAASLKLGRSVVIEAGSYAVTGQAAALTIETPYILDAVAATVLAAYSTRKLRAAYSGPAIRVRRSSDNAEQDIGFSGEDLDTSALATFVGASQGFVKTWYDQSGNGNNATQTAAGNQAAITDASGNLHTINGQAAALTASDHDDWYSLTSTLTTVRTLAMVFDIVSLQNHNHFTGHVSTYGWHSGDGTGGGAGGAGDWYDAGYADATVVGGTLRVNGAAVSTTGAITTAPAYSNLVTTGNGPSLDRLFRDRTIAGRGPYGYSGEIVIFSDALDSSQISTMESNRASYWSI